MGGTGEGGDFGDERLRTAPVTVRCLLFFDLFFDLRPSLMTESLPSHFHCNRVYGAFMNLPVTSISGDTA